MSQLCPWAVVILCFLHHASADTLFIEKVTCQRVATAYDSWIKTGIEALFALANAKDPAQSAGATLSANGLAAAGDLPLTLQEVLDAVQAGRENGQKVIAFLEKYTGGDDDLIININGEHVYPNGGSGYVEMVQGQTIQPNIAFDFGGKARIQFIEYDSGSDNDNLGSIDVKDNVSPGQNYEVEGALLFSAEEGDVYEVNYRVERNDRGKEAKWILCGTAACKVCTDDPCCEATTNDNLDRDGDDYDLRTCPPGFTDRGMKKYDIWLFEDVKLRICANEAATSPARCDADRSGTGWLQRLTDTLRSIKSLKRQLLQDY